MPGYDRYEMEDYDDFIEYGSEQEEEHVEKEAPKPTKEELEYLQLRQRLKEQIRRQMKKENGSARSKSNPNGCARFNDQKNKFPFDNFGSFFGPSQPVIAQRVIQESKSLLETQHLASRVSNSSNGVHNKKSVSKSSGSRSGAHVQPSKAAQLKSELQKVKDSRDYSFLLSDAEFPASTEEAPPRTVYVPKSEARPIQAPEKSRRAFGNSGPQVQSSHGDKKSTPLNGQIRSRGMLTPSSKIHCKPEETKKQLGSVNGNRPGLPLKSKDLSSRTATTVPKKQSISGVKNAGSVMQKTLPPKLQSSIPVHHSVQKKEMRERADFKMLPKQQVASTKSQTMKPPQKQTLQRPPLKDHQPKKKSRPFDDADDEEDGRAIDMIRKMFRYNPTNYSNRDDDDSDMEANFDDIMREEKRSEKIARREDEEQLLLIQEEEERERRARMNKTKKRNC